LALSGYIFSTIPGKIPQLSSPGKYPFYAHIAATGTIMRFVRCNSQAITIIFTRSGQTFRYGGPHWKLYCNRRSHITFVYFSYDIRFKIWINDNIISTLHCFISHWHSSTHRWNKISRILI